MRQYLLQKTVHQFIGDISEQHQAVTGTVIMVSGAQLVALAEACMQISLDHQVDTLNWHDVSSRIANMAQIKETLIECGNGQLALLTELRPLDYEQTNNHWLQSTGKFLAEATALMIEATDILQNFGPMVLEQVRQDVAVTQQLMVGTVQAALTLLEGRLNSGDTSAEVRETMQLTLTTLQNRVKNLFSKQQLSV